MTASLRVALGAALVLGSLPSLAAAQTRGPSSSQDPYLVPVAPGVETVSILTVGDTTPDGYRMVGIPDGLGAFRASAGAFSLVMNHELGTTAGSVRAHGQTGSFVSKWLIRRDDLAVLAGQDLIQSAEIVTGGAAFSRFCSGDLADGKAFWFGRPGPELYLNGEETGAEGRAFAHVASGPNQGQSYELPSLGNLSFENVVARPFPSPRTAVVGTDDSTPGQVYLYLGWKRFLGNEVERAGLTEGTLHGIRVPGVLTEDRATGIGAATRFELASLGDVSALSGAQLQAASAAAGVTEFLRPEDCAWDTLDPRVLYFVTTDRFDSESQVGRSRLWRLRFDHPLRLELGGTIEAVLDGTEGQQMMDNIAVDQRGNVLIQEDPGNQVHLARVWMYKPVSDTLVLLAQHDPSRFLAGAPDFLTQDEECSGIIDASTILGAGWYLLDVQAHYALGGELVEGGQLLALRVPRDL